MFFLFENEKTYSETEIKKDLNELLNKDEEIKEISLKTKVPILIKKCENGIRALYHIKNKEIWICPEKINIGCLKEVLKHELIHSYDHLIKKIDLSTKKGLAKSEIHAMKHCECKNSWFKKRCTFNKAIEAVSLSINNLDEAKEIVTSIFSESYNENLFLSPFD